MRRRIRVKNVPLVAAMAATGITGRELASRAGITPTTLSHVVNQRTDPRPETAAAIARALNSTPAALGLMGGAR